MLVCRQIYHTSSSAVAQSPRDASCLSVVSFNSTISRAQSSIVFYYLPPTTEEVYVFARAPAFVCLSVCLSVCVQDYSKTRAWIWMKCCVSTDNRFDHVPTRSRNCTFQPDLDYSPDAGTGLLSPIAYALQRGILLRRKNLTLILGARRSSDA